MGAVDLVAFIEQRLTEDELWAKAASAPASYYLDERPVPPDGAHWTWAVGENWTPYAIDPLEEFVGEGASEYAATSLVTVEQWPTGYDRTSPNKVLAAEEVATGIGAHIVRHDPARVLREVEATRAVLAEYQRARERRAKHPDDLASAGALLTMIRVTKLLAAPYSSHPDYRTEWAA